MLRSRMKEDNFRVSVIIPVYNCELYLRAAIESVLAQTHKPWEIIVVDDGSTDKSAEIAKRFEPLIKYSFIHNSGSSAAVNHGISLSQGDVIGFLDADDIWLPNKLALQIAAFRENPELEAIFGHLQQFKSWELSEDIKNKLKIPVEISPAYHRDTLLIKRLSLERVGLFDSRIQMGEFIDWYLRAEEQDLKSLILGNILAKRRLHKTNMGIRDRQSRTEYARVIKASLDRRRKLGIIPSSE